MEMGAREKGEWRQGDCMATLHHSYEEGKMTAWYSLVEATDITLNI